MYLQHLPPQKSADRGCEQLKGQCDMIKKIAKFSTTYVRVGPV